MGCNHSAIAHAGHSHAPPPVVKKSSENSSSTRYAKTGKDFEVVLVVPKTDKSFWTVYVSDSTSNRPIGNASVSILLKDKTKAEIPKTDEVGIYQNKIPTNDVDKVSIIVEKQNFKETFAFTNLKLLDKRVGRKSLGLVLASVGGLLLLLCMTLFRKRLKSLLFLPLCFVSVYSLCYAHGGHQHAHPEEAKKTADAPVTEYPHMVSQTSNGIRVPKDIQFHLGIVTRKVRQRSLKGTTRLVGYVISDPSGYARLQATQNARVVNSPDHPLPLPGQRVKKGQVILSLQPTLSKIETTDQRSMLYGVESEIVQLKKEVNRKEKLGPYVSRKELENARTELERAIKQKEEILTKTFKPEYLTSPLDGIVADLHVRPGEIVNPERSIVEIVDPSKLLIEAFVFDPTIADEIVGGVARLPLVPDKSIQLKLIGVSPKVSKEDQSIHVLFKAEEQDSSIKLDMAVEVLGYLRTMKPSIAIQKKAIIEDDKGAWVFVHTAPEMFEARKVRIRRTVGEMVEIENGLSLGEKIVVDGAYLLHQAK